MTEETSGLGDVSETKPPEPASSTDPIHALSPGDRLDDFTILEEIGRGGMGIVYKASESALRRVVALKVLNPEIVQNASLAKRFRREAILAANLSHPNIVPVFHVEDREQPRYFTMEFISGRSLKEKVKAKGYLHPEQATRITLQACDALGYLHTEHIIHRDVKPANILLQNHVERVRITDFGIAKDVTGRLADRTETEGITPGTLPFMSPEQNLGRNLDGRTDIFSLGMTLYYMLAGCVAYDARNRAELAVAFEKQVPLPPSRYNPEVTPQLDAVVMKMIAVAPEDRYRDMASVGKALREVQSGRAHRRWSSLPKRPILLLAMCTLVIVAGLTVIRFLWPNGGIPAPNTVPRIQEPVLKEMVLMPAGECPMKLVPIPAGKFTMGSSEKGPGEDEGLLHEVTISKPFYMGITEVTQAQYEAVMGTNPSRFKGETNPVEMVSWNEATEFCKRLSEKTRQAVRLPTEAEWEYACRAGSKTRFSFGDSEDDAPEYAWTKGNSAGTTHAVGQKKPNAWGLYDMHGNVWEWCADWLGAYPGGPVVDPTGPGSGSTRVLRGGSWRFGTATCRAAFRSNGFPVSRDEGAVGFRVALDSK